MVQARPIVRRSCRARSEQVTEMSRDRGAKTANGSSDFFGHRYRESDLSQRPPAPPSRHARGLQSYLLPYRLGRYGT